MDGLILCAGGAELDLDRHEVRTTLRLSASEWRLLACLSEQIDRFVPIRLLYEAVWQREPLSPSEAGELLRDLVHKTRRKLGLAADALSTSHGYGYMLRSDPRDTPAGDKYPR